MVSIDPNKRDTVILRVDNARTGLLTSNPQCLRQIEDCWIEGRSNKKTANVNPTPWMAALSEGESESIKKPKNVNPTSRRATFSEGESG